ncbi:MAG: CHASE2 domain-containing protein, partial [Cyanobacteria bacterium J06632_3]
MEQQVLLTLGRGDWQRGFADVTVQLWETQQPPMQFVGSLPPAPELAAQYRHWRKLYEALFGAELEGRGRTQHASGEGLGESPVDIGEVLGELRRSADFEFEENALTNVSQQQFETLGHTLKVSLNQWLTTAEFGEIERRMRTYLTPQAPVRVMLSAHDETVLRFPWRLWQLFEDYPDAELSLSLPSYSRSFKQTQGNAQQRVRILAVLGNDRGIDVETDRRLLAQLALADVTLLAQPTLSEVQEYLWSGHWDVLFFAGHSNSRHHRHTQDAGGDLGRGYLQVNETEGLTIEQLKFSLNRAIANGLQLAILNSCDGLGLAWDLAELRLPQAIVMREPLPDTVAHQFLKNFLAVFSQGRSLYSAVREAREKLHSSTALGTCAAWLPVIVQNPAETPPTWRSLAGLAALPVSEPISNAQPPSKLLRRKQAVGLPSRWVCLNGLAVALVVFGLRWMGWLQSLELSAYDAMLKLRPAETPDPRLVVVTVDEDDIQAQASLERRGSLSDETLERTLTALAGYEPRLVAVDLYRDFESIRPGLTGALRQASVLGVCKSRDSSINEIGIAPPPEMAETQVGFTDFVEDSDGVVRRQLLTLTPEPVSPCVSRYSIAALLAIQYLQIEGYDPAFTAEGNLQIGDVVFPRLGPRSGGLQSINHQGNQILLNYRALTEPKEIAAQVPLQKLLLGEVNGESLRDRIVLIGITATSGDYWATPYEAKNRTPGVYLQAQMTSQLLSAVLDGRAVMWVWPPWGDAAGIAITAIIGSLFARRWRFPMLGLVFLLWAAGLFVIAWVALAMGGWLPLVPVL